MSKPLITPDQIGNFPAKQGIAIFNGQPPIKYQRIIYYNDMRFESRLLHPIHIYPIKLCPSLLRAKKYQKLQQEKQESVHLDMMQKILPAITKRLTSLVKENNESIHNMVIDKKMVNDDSQAMDKI